MSLAQSPVSHPVDMLRFPTVDQVGIEERVDRLNKRSIKKSSKVFALKLALSMLDLSTLAGDDSPGKVRQLCVKARHLHDVLPDLPHVAAVCIYPTMIPYAKPALEGSGIKIAAVARGFPSGQYPLSTRLEETRLAVEAGGGAVELGHR